MERPGSRQPPAPTRPDYSRAERRADAAVHVAGLAAAALGVPGLLLAAIAWRADGPTLAAAAVYAASLAVMLVASALYHLVPRVSWQRWLRRIDHAAIYVKIAGTYTPFAVLFAGGEAVWILAAMWGAAGIGAALKIAAPGRWEGLSVALYLAMGWAVVVIGGPILAGMSEAGVAMVVLGGVLYTAGVGFHLWHRLPFQNAIWHLFVLAATGVFYAAVLGEIARTAPGA